MNNIIDTTKGAHQSFPIPYISKKVSHAGIFSYSPSLRHLELLKLIPAENNKFLRFIFFENDLDNTYTGTGQFAGFSYSAHNEMYQNAVEVSYAWKF